MTEQITNALPPVVDHQTWQAALDELRTREKAATRELDAIAAQLGDRPYLMGAAPCGADATVFAWVLGFLCPRFASPLRAAPSARAE